ncbi:MAG TPA: glycosyltransferase [Sedimentisphaerales bacterium]|nr:glycosyltransferase [Sedimentisphaerales bacterium]
MGEKCSVVIPAFNAAGFIRRTIDSVLAQTYQDYEVIVVDDGSNDNTAEQVKGYGAKVRYIYQQNAGGDAARNAGIVAARGEWIALLDHDDEWLPEKLHLQMELLKRHPELRWCGSNYYKASFDRRAVATDISTLRKALGNRAYFENFFAALCECRISLAPSTVLIRKNVFDEVGLFSSLYCADIDMWLRIAYRFPAIGYLPEVLAVLHVVAQDSTSTRIRLKAKRDAVQYLVARHLGLAKQQGMLEEFKPVAKRFLRLQLITTLYHGFRAESRLIVSEHREFFPWYWRVATYILTTFPKLTSSIAKAVAYVWYRLGLEREVSRRWISSSRIAENADE